MKQKQRTASITIRLTPEKKDELIKFAEDNNMTITQVIEDGFYCMRMVDDRLRYGVVYAHDLFNFKRTYAGEK